MEGIGEDNDFGTGVTVPRIHVLVIGTDYPVLDVATLVQIAGRAGGRVPERCCMVSCRRKNGRVNSGKKRIEMVKSACLGSRIWAKRGV
jgi:late competence protein required for DNA uptake (superfamily II DNA/RNA helicase)